ncbi:UNVERIFIED_CONTAM: hypothetical protein FKN15_077941 [Acipenser sinensis]
MIEAFLRGCGEQQFTLQASVSSLAPLEMQKLQFVSVLGAGLLCGTALAIIIPEGIELLQDSVKGTQYPCVTALNRSATVPHPSPGSLAEKSLSLPPHFLIGVSLVVGFILMFIVDQIASYCSFHADGVALGAAVASSQVSVQVIVFFAVILHKAPAAFGLVSFLMHAGLEKRQIQKHLLAFSIAAPVLATMTYFILSQTGGSSAHRLSATGIGMLFSAGTFLYVATVHVLPEISSRGHLHAPQHHSSSGEFQQGGLGVLESLTLIIGAGLPVLISLGLHDN